MITNRRTMTYIAIALIIGVALAFAVALSRTDSSAGTMTDAQVAAAAASQAALLGDDALAADPAKKQPSLDQFSSKDPFVPLDVAASTNTTDTSGDTSLSAKIKVNGTAYTVSTGDKVPSGDPVFTVSSITSSDVTFALIDAEFTDGSNTLTVPVGETGSAKSKDTGKTYTIVVVSIGDNTGGGSTDGHSISVLSITSQDGTAMVTIKVDSTVYSDKKQGDTFSTGWGEIKILSINVSAQTVTIMHGDQTLTLHAGQAVVK